MKFVRLGGSSLEVSNICIGTWQIGQTFLRSQGKPRAVKLDKWDLEKALEVFQRAETLGINFVDTASAYGSEQWLGNHFKNNNLDKEHWVIATKIHHRSLSRENVQRSYFRSKETMGKVDVLYIHHPNPEIPIEETYSGFMSLIDSGENVVFGLSNFLRLNEADLVYAFALPREGIGIDKWMKRERTFRIDVWQEGFNLLWWTREKYIGKLGATFVAYSPLFQGLLGGNYSPYNLPNDLRRDYWGFQLLRDMKLVQLFDAIRKIAELEDLSFAQVAFGWVLAKGALPIVACRTVEQLEELVSTEPLKRENVEILDNLVKDIEETKNPPAWLQGGVNEK